MSVLSRPHSELSEARAYLRIEGNPRNRFSIAVSIVVIVAMGLASRKWPWLLPAWLGKYPGDALWAAMVYWIVAFILPSAPVARVAAWALAISYLDELTQLYQAPWLNQIRSTTPGHLLLGSTFSWLDLFAYTAGVALCSAVEVCFRRAGGDRSRKHAGGSPA